MTEGTEFVCADCGAYVFQAIAETPRPDPQLCYQCQWLATFNADEREAVEQYLDRWGW